MTKYRVHIKVEGAIIPQAIEVQATDSSAAADKALQKAKKTWKGKHSLHGVIALEVGKNRVS